ncbi:hypothetical protein XENOCAPTIV_001151 [Xenoophorus captivus]|uniref:Uncharacterized protein n=1 Tax=Xenoophorus captivus TaxID=1517983 RepID=A0ABV0RXZ3_9TELE
MLPQPETICQLPYSVDRDEPDLEYSAANLIHKVPQECCKNNKSCKVKPVHHPTYPLLGTANGLLPVRVAPCSDWLEEDELEDLASLTGWESCSSKGFCLHQATIEGEEVGTFLLGTEKDHSSSMQNGF